MPMVPLLSYNERFMSMQVTCQKDTIDRITDNIVGAVMPFSKEKERRIIAAAIAEALGHGGLTYVSDRSKMSRNTISKAIPEMKSRFEETRQTDTASKTDDKEDSSSERATNHQEFEEESPEQLTLEELIERFYGKQPAVKDKDRQRKKGGGRKRSIDLYPDLLPTVEQIVSASSYGNPESLITYTSLSLRDIADELNSKHGMPVSRNVVSDVLEILGYSKQQNKKLEQVGKDHIDRDAQFKHIEETAGKYLMSGEPVISIDCKKKEHLGNHKNNGQEYRKVKDARPVRDHDYIIPELGSVAPYGVYTMNNNTGFVNLGISHDTPEFSVASIRAWWYTVGKNTFPDATMIYVTCDGGGSNSSRVRMFKT